MIYARTEHKFKKKPWYISVLQGEAFRLTFKMCVAGEYKKLLFVL